MTVLSGDVLYLTFQGVSIHTDFRSFDPGIEYQTADATAGNDVAMSEILTKIKVAPKLKVVVDNDATGLAIRAALKLGQSGQLIWGEHGNATGLPKGGINATVKKSTVSGDPNKEQELDVEFMNTSGTLLFDPRTAVF